MTTQFNYAARVEKAIAHLKKFSVENTRYVLDNELKAHDEVSDDQLSKIKHCGEQIAEILVTEIGDEESSFYISKAVGNIENTIMGKLASFVPKNSLT